MRSLTFGSESLRAIDSRVTALDDIWLDDTAASVRHNENGRRAPCPQRLGTPAIAEACGYYEIAKAEVH